MQSISPEHPRGASALWASGPEERRAQAGELLARMAALDPERLLLALAFLIGYHPRVLDAALSAIEPRVTLEGPGQEPYCVRCGAPVGIFLAHGKEYRHYRGVVTATRKPKPYKADHAPVVGWRPASDMPDAIAG
jgi:hypothetical protein